MAVKLEAPFDQVVGGYDEIFTNSQVGKAQRTVVLNYLENIIGDLSGNKVLELSCGTGEDATWFLEHGFELFATDLSSGMVREAENKVRSKGLMNGRFFQMDMNDVDELPGSFDLIFSNFGGLNCLSPLQLGDLSRKLSDRLNPKGRLILVIMPKQTLWERLYYLFKLKPREAFRRNRKKPLKVNLEQGAQATWYYNPADIRRLFGEGFEVKAIRPVGFFIPPSYLSGYFTTKETLFNRLVKCEQKVSQKGWLSRYSDHFLIDLQKTK